MEELPSTDWTAENEFNMYSTGETGLKYQLYFGIFETSLEVIPISVIRML